MNEPLTCLHTEAMTAEREWTVDDVPALSAAVSLPEPVPAADRVSRRIRRYYQLQCRSFLRYCEKALLPQAAAEVRAALEASQPLPRFQAELTYQVTYKLRRAVEPADPVPGIRARLGDGPSPQGGYLGSRPPATLSRWRTSSPGGAAGGGGSSRWRRRRCGTGRRPGSPGTGRALHRLLRRQFNPENFYLTAEGLAFFYPMYAIAPAAEGVPTFLMRGRRSGGRNAGSFAAWAALLASIRPHCIKSWSGDAAPALLIPDF